MESSYRWLSCLLFCIYVVDSNVAAASFMTNETDHLALLKIKDLLRGADADPLDALSSWSTDNNSLHFCNWHGVTCSIAHQRVIVLNISSLKLTGSLSPFAGNLTFLRELNVQDNQLGGRIPLEIAQLRRLQYLRLANNSFSGSIPAGLSRCRGLQVIDIKGNDLVGNVPIEFSSLTDLYELSLDRNNLTGTIPPAIGNLTSLRILGLTRNQLHGSIPVELGQLSNLIFMRLSSNRLSGIVPSQLYNISSIQTFAITNNQLIGQFPPNMGLTLPDLSLFLAAFNQFTGFIPPSLANATRLVKISLGDNNLTGPIPLNLGRLQELDEFHIGHNSFGAYKGNDMSILLSSLLNCSNLRVLSLSKIGIGGMLPKSVGNLSKTLEQLYLNKNYLQGTIPQEIGNLVGLNYLTLDTNMLTGSIPDSVGKLNMIQELYFFENRISGKIPSSIGNITGISILILEDNILEGNIPISLGNCSGMLGLHLAFNHLTGPIPEQIFGLSTLSIGLNLAGNQLSGPLSAKVGSLQKLTILELSGNKLSGEIPATLGGCLMLESLNLRDNSFEGTIPPSLEKLKNVEDLDLSRNKLSGMIPDTLKNMKWIGYLNLSFNKLEGEVPKEGVFSHINKFAVNGNTKLCGGIKQLNISACPVEPVNRKRKLSTRTKIILASAIPFSIVLLLACVYAIHQWMRKQKQTLPSVIFENTPYPKISYAELVRATSEFSSENLIGEGRYGSVYKGILTPNGQIVAVKVLKMQEYGANKSFLAECEALRNARHRNLVKIITSCSSVDFQGNDFRALVFDYMPNGSLQAWVHQNSSDRDSLNLIQRLNAAIDVAYALDYLHHHCIEPIVHCDLKLSNILLDNDLSAHVSDFGLARILSNSKATASGHSHSSTIGIRGTIGYVPPEYGMGGDISAKGDVYSYGILLLEIFTGKAPVDSMFGEHFSIVDYVKTAIPYDVMKIVDQLILVDMEDCLNEKSQGNTYNKTRMDECLCSIFQIGLSCSAEMPGQRMDIEDVLVNMNQIKKHLTEK